MLMLVVGHNNGTPKDNHSLILEPVNVTLNGKKNYFAEVIKDLEMERLA